MRNTVLLWAADGGMRIIAHIMSYIERPARQNNIYVGMDVIRHIYCIKQRHCNVPILLCCCVSTNGPTKAEEDCAMLCVPVAV